MQRTASSTVAASPSTSTSPSSSARTPARNSWWSSTMTTLGASLMPCHPQLDLGALAGRRVDAARPPWRSMRPTIDSRTPRRSAGTAPGSKPGPRSRTNTSMRVVADLGVEPTPARRRRTSRRSRAPRARRPRAPRRARRAARRRPRRRRPARRGRPRPRRRPPRARPARSSARRRPAAVEPRAQLALLAAGERRRPSRGSSARCCISASVCSTESCRCAATSARSCERIALGALGGEPAHEPQPPRREDQRRPRPAPRPPAAPRRARAPARR